MRRLIQLSYSPWSEKARWALDHHAIEREQVEYFPMLGERQLRRTVGKRSGRVTVPVLIDGDTVIGESLEIARWADRVGSGVSLFPEGEDATIESWDETGERMLEASRAVALRRSATDRAAIAESLPGVIPAALRPWLVFVGRSGIRHMDRKYQTRALDDAKADEISRDALGRLREGLSGRAHLVGDRFSYADVSMAVALQLLCPVADRFVKVGPAARRCCTREELVRDFADLFEWRDGLYDRHRRR